MLNFDTHAAVKKLHKAGLDTKVAEEIVISITSSRNSDLSVLVNKDMFFKFQEGNTKKLNGLDKKIDLVNKEIALIKQEMQSMRQENESATNNLKQLVIAEVTKSKNETIRWVLGMFIALLIAIFAKSHF